MFTVTTYAIFWIIIFLVLGVKWYVLDRTFGVKLYRFCYKLTHEQPLPPDDDRGFIFRQTTKRKIFMATLVSTFQSVLALLYSDVNPLLELFMWGFEVPVTLFGFYSAPYIYKWWTKKEHLFEWIDQVESGRRDPWAWFKNNWSRAKQGVSEGLDSFEEALKPRDAETRTDPVDAAPAKAQEPDPREMVRKYINNRK